MADLRRVTPNKPTASSVLQAAKLQRGEYLFAFWMKRSGEMTSADITTGTGEKMAYILKYYSTRGCTHLGFVVSSTPGRKINPHTQDQLQHLVLFGA